MVATWVRAHHRYEIVGDRDLITLPVLACESGGETLGS